MSETHHDSRTRPGRLHHGSRLPECISVTAGANELAFGDWAYEGQSVRSEPVAVGGVVGVSVQVPDSHTVAVLIKGPSKLAGTVESSAGLTRS